MQVYEQPSNLPLILANRIKSIILNEKVCAIDSCGLQKFALGHGVCIAYRSALHDRIDWYLMDQCHGNTCVQWKLQQSMLDN